MLCAEENDTLVSMALGEIGFGKLLDVAGRNDIVSVNEGFQIG